jgi:hypothetical protein
MRGSKVKKILPLPLMMFLVITTVCLLGMLLCILLDMTSSEGPQCDPPEGFSKGDLLGTWIAGSPDQSDTLIIKADGTYKQIVHIEFASKPPVDYESDWQAWWLEYDEVVTIPSLHLEGYRLCGYNAGVSCDIPGGSGSHMCQVDYKDIPGEGVLYVMRGWSEFTLTLPLLENSWGYSRKP